MKKIQLSILLLGLIASLFPLSARAEMKIGYVDSTMIMEKSPQAQAFKQKLDRALEPRRNKLLKKQNEIQKLEESLVRDSAIMGDAEKLEVERNARSLKRDLRRMQEEFSDEVNTMRNEGMMTLQEKVVSTIHDYAKKNQYDLIINESVVVYASHSIDITDDVIKMLVSGK